MKLDANFKGGMLSELNSLMESADEELFSIADTYDAVNATLSGLTQGDGNGIDEEEINGAAGSKNTKPAILGSEGEDATEPEEDCGCNCDEQALLDCDEVGGANLVDQSIGEDGIVEKVKDVIANNEAKMSGQGEFDPLGLFRDMFKVNVNDTDNTYGEGFSEDVQ